MKNKPLPGTGQRFVHFNVLYKWPAKSWENGTTENTRGKTRNIS